MNSGPFLFFGLFLTMACSWLSFIMGPQLQIGDLRPTTNILVGALGQVYPHTEPGTAHQGAEIYRANGCAACHTQQVRPASLGSDIRRGWGSRRSTASDYIYENDVMLGSLRVGPDLANAGKRMDAATVLMRLYDPASVANSEHFTIMPSYSYMFDRRKIEGARSPDALPLPTTDGYEIVPKPEARQLAAYVMSLHQDGYLYEAPPPPGATNVIATNAPAGATNAAMTNSPAK